MIHPTAIIDPRAEIAEDVTIGAYSIIKNDVKIGAGTEIGPHVVVDPYVTLGENCKIYQYAAIGGDPQIVGFSGEETFVKIGNGTVIREFATIHRASAHGEKTTVIGEKCYLMAYTHVAHDCQLGNNVILANNASLAGHVTVDDNATIGGLVGVHQFVRIGKFAFIGGKSTLVKDVPPFMIAAGDRASLCGLNKVGLRRNGFSPEAISALKKAYRIVFRIGLTLNEAIDRVKAEVEHVGEIDELITFITSSQRGITR